MMDWTDLTATIWALLDEHGLLTVFVLLLLEEAGLPLVIPADLLMVMIGIQAAEGKVGLLQAFLVLEVATVIGASILYRVSAVGGHAVVERVGKHVGATPERLHRMALSLDRHGSAAIVAGRLLPSLCILTAVAAGVLGYPYRRFLPALIVGGFLHLLLYVMLGYWLGPPVLRVLSAVHLPFEVLAALLALVGIGFWLIVSARQTAATPIMRRPMRDRVARGLLAGLLGAVVATLLAHVCLPLAGLLAAPAPSAAGLDVASLDGGTARVVVLLIVVPFFIVSTLWGAVYGMVEPLLGGHSWARAAAFGLVPLACSLLVFLPLAGGGWLGLGMGAGSLPVLGELVRSLVYGLSLGKSYGIMSPHLRLQRQSV